MPDNRTSSDEHAERDWGITCAEFLELTTEYLEDALTPADRTRFEDHLGRCDGCETVLGHLTDVVHATGQLEEDDVDPDTMTALLNAFKDWKSPADDP